MSATPPKRSTLREYFESLCIAVVLAMFLRTFVFQNFVIPTGSMEESLLIGDHLLVNKMLYHQDSGMPLLPTTEFERGDVVVFKFPEEPDRDFIKRVIGLPGETVQVDGTEVSIDGRPLDEDYTQFVFGGGRGRRDYRVPEQHVFVMGDSRDNSHDSRFWGSLPQDHIKGKALFIYWSYDAPREEYLQTHAAQKALNLLLVPFRFIQRTRWQRFFQSAS